MSRHRNVRNLDIEGVLEEDHYSDEYDENELDETQLSNEDVEALEEGLAYIRGMVQNSDFIPDVEIKEALWYYYFDKEETLNWVLDKVAKEEKRKEKEAKKAAKDQRKPHYRRPPAKLYSDSIASMDTPAASRMSLQQLSKNQGRPLSSNMSSLRQLALNGKRNDVGLSKQKATGDKGEATVPSSSAGSLRSLVQQAAGQRGVSALQNLASRHTQTSTNVGQRSVTTRDGSTARSSLASLAQASGVGGGKGLSSLAQLASRRKADTTLKPDAKCSSTSMGLAALAKRSTAITKEKDDQPLVVQTETSVVAEPAAKPTSTTSTSSTPLQGSTKMSTTVQKTILPTTADNPLCAPPSSAARFLFSPMESFNRINTHIERISAPLPNSIAQTLYEAMRSSATNCTVAPSKEVAKQKQKQTKTVTKTKASTKEEDEIVEYLSDEEVMVKDMESLGLGSKTVAQTRLKAIGSTLTTPASTPPDSPRAGSPLAKIPPAKRVNVPEEYAKRSGEKPKLNLVVIGHVDAGKSTLMGHFLYALGQVNERTMKKFERDSQKIGKGSFAYAWVLDETGEERDRGITMDIAVNNFETAHRKFTLLDAPGHRDFIPNMISGTAQADVAILVVDATTGGFESGFDANGQTKEHALLARSLGVQQMIVAVNKLDVISWDAARFNEIVGKLSAFLTQAGFRKSNLSYVPVSGLTGQNLIQRSKVAELTAWYNGPSLMELVDAFEPPVRLLDKPFRLGVTDFFKGGIGSGGGVSIAGSVDAGHIQVGEQVMVVPGSELGVIKAMQVNDESANWAAAGDSVLMTLSGLDIMNLSTGCVLCSPLAPVPVTSSFTAQIVVFDIKVPITSGFPVILHHQSLNEPASIVQLLSVLDKSTGEVIKKNPRYLAEMTIQSKELTIKNTRHLTKGSTAKVRIELSHRPIPLETFKDNKQLGRIMLRKGGDTVAAGVVDETHQ
ncbi:HBS1-like protein [Apophysomyces ossiformis]|uniref:Elongation factor 1 alpha-like protein n=1 Tax=Apophysomyces ossiformis TaxID=679940 RepID=A0A8H7C0J5_9FUNG|nr:HBS1-like protein [Apophysomyces ossiformis]